MRRDGTGDQLDGHRPTGTLGGQLGSRGVGCTARNPSAAAAHQPTQLEQAMRRDAGNQLDGHRLKRATAGGGTPAPERQVKPRPSAVQAVFAECKDLRRMEAEAQDEMIRETARSIRWSCAKAHGEQRRWVLVAEVVAKTRAQQKAEHEVKWGDMDQQEKELYQAAMDDEWAKWLELKAVRIISAEQARGVDPARVLPTRYVLTDKNKGADMKTVEAKARLCCDG